MELKETIERDGRQLKLMMQEAVAINYEEHPAQLAESEGATAQKGGRWTADIWRLDKPSLNETIYSTALAERICKEGTRTIVYDGHFADWASGNEYKCAVAVAKNPWVEGGLMKCEIEFLKDEDSQKYEARLKELIAQGVKVGVSSVGYGYMDENGNIEESSYVVVRLMDFVTMPAYEVYATFKAEPDDGEEKAPEREAAKESVEVPSESAMAAKRERLAKLIKGESRTK